MRLRYGAESCPGKAAIVLPIRNGRAITTVYDLEDGRLIAQCHTPDKAEFDAWLKKSGWTVKSLTQIKTVANTGYIGKC